MSTVTYVIVDLIFSVTILMQTMTGINVKIAFRLNLENVSKVAVQIPLASFSAPKILKLL